MPLFPSKSHKATHCCCNVGPLSAILAQPHISSGSMIRNCLIVRRWLGGGGGGGVVEVIMRWWDKQRVVNTALNGSHRRVQLINGGNKSNSNCQFRR